jgi:hypothetical protein
MNDRHTSETDSWFTPPEIIEAARSTLEEIDLDPASCSRANETVKAARFFGAGSSVGNGFTTSWAGRVFLNPPGGRCDENGVRVVAVPGKSGFYYADGSPCVGSSRSASKAWWEKLSNEWAAGEVTAGIFLGFSMEILQTTQVKPGAEFVPCDFPLCFPSTRLAFVGPDGKPVRGNTHASVIVLLPFHGGSAYREITARFVRSFSSIGRCVNVEGIARNV